MDKVDNTNKLHERFEAALRLIEALRLKPWEVLAYYQARADVALARDCHELLAKDQSYHDAPPTVVEALRRRAKADNELCIDTAAEMHDNRMSVIERLGWAERSVFDEFSTTENFACSAAQHADHMVCEKCGLVWDTNDPSPPECQLKLF